MLYGRIITRTHVREGTNQAHIVFSGGYGTKNYGSEMPRDGSCLGDWGEPTTVPCMMSGEPPEAMCSLSSQIATLSLSPLMPP